MSEHDNECELQDVLDGQYSLCCCSERRETKRLRELLREALDPYARASIDWRVGWTNRVREALGDASPKRD